MGITNSPVDFGAIQVGDVLPSFEGIDEFGESFNSESLQGQLVLIKFFRAHW